jgi:catechol 2,3-dioxygenase-like lactoylglutathione lyase family enzyme
VQATRILETCLYAEDLAAAEEFYARVLGLEVFAREAGRHVFFRARGGVFLVFNPAQTSKPRGDWPAHGATGPGHVAFAISPDDVAAWRDRLERQGVAIEKEATWPSGGRSLYFRDPAGNCLELATPSTWKLPDIPEESPG